VSVSGRAAWALVGAYSTLSAVRIALSVRNWRRVQAGSRSASAHGDAQSASGPITVMQPILSGDPALPRLLGENLANNPSARFLWLVDLDDAEGRRITGELAASSDRVEVLLCPPCPPLTNPKVFKLALGLPRCTELVAVLDDDTVLPPNALATACAALGETDLATGLPWYPSGAGPWARLVAGFVNGNALVTYFPLLGCGQPVTINGMFYLTSRTALTLAGGFEAILDRVCDDYELAQLYRRAGLRLAQTTITHPVITEVPDAAAYVRLMHRWMVFAGRLLRSSLSPRLALLVLAPATLPPIALAVALGSGAPGAALGIGVAVGAKVAATQAARARLTPEVPRRFGYEYVSDWLLPLQSAIAMLLPRRITWRGRRLRVVGGRLR